MATTNELLEWAKGDESSWERLHELCQLAANVAGDALSAEEALNQLKGTSSPNGQDGEVDSEQAAAAMDIGLRLMGKAKREAARIFFSYAESEYSAALNRVGDDDPVTKAGYPTVSQSTTVGPESPLGTAYVVPGKTYTVYFQKSGLSVYGLSFITPEGYAVYVNGSPVDMFTVSGGLNYTTYTLEVKPIASMARVDAATFSGIDVGKAIGWDVALGGLNNGTSAGRILFKQPDLTTGPSSRSTLFYLTPMNNTQITTIIDGSGYLRQVMTPQVLADLVDDGSGGYYINFYIPGTDTSGTGAGNTPFTIVSGHTPWRQIHVTSSGSTLMTITETDPGATDRVSKLSITSGTIASGNYGLTLQEGDGTTWLRTSTHTSTAYTTPSNYREDVVVVAPAGPGTSVARKTKFRYENPGWGEELTAINADPDTAALVTSFVYETNTAYYGNYRRIKTITQPTGNWVSRLYYDDWNRRGQLAVETHPYVNSPGTPVAANITVGDSTVYDYSADPSGRYRNLTSSQTNITNIQGGGMSSTETLGNSRYGTGPSETYSTFTRNDSSSSGSSQQTYTEVLDSTGLDPSYFGQVLCVKRPNQTQDSYFYSYGVIYGSNLFAFGVGDCFATIVMHGTTSSSGADSVTSYASLPMTQVYMVPNKSTMVISVRNSQGLVVDEETWLYTGSGGYNMIGHNSYTYDYAGRLTNRMNDFTTTLENSYVSNRLDTTKDALGNETKFTYDNVYRVNTKVKKGASYGSYTPQSDITTTFSYNGADDVTQTVVSGAGGLSQTSTAQYDPAGRLSQSVTPGGYTTSSVYSSGGKLVTTTLPSGSTTVSEVYLDGQLKSVSGSGAIAENYSPFIDAGTGNRAVQSYVGGISSAWTNTYFDWLGRKIQEWRPEWDGLNHLHGWYYNTAGQLYKYVQPAMADTLYVYDTLGAISSQGLDINGNGTLDAASSDRIIYSTYAINTWDSGANWYKANWNYTYANNGSGTLTLLGYTLEHLYNAANYLSQKYVVDVHGNTTYEDVVVDRTNKIVNDTVYAPDSSIPAYKTTFNGLCVVSRDTANVTTAYGYDGLGRLTQSTDPRTGTTTTTYISGTDQIYKVTDPTTVVDQATYTYDSAGRIATVTNGLGKVARYDYTARGEKQHVWGNAEFPIEFGYDSSGRQTSMSTYRGGSGWGTATSWAGVTAGTADTSTWSYDAPTGLLKQKFDATPGSPKHVDYTYTVGRQLYTRTWSRGTITTYGYDSATGEQTSIGYSDGTPGITYTFNRLGKMATVSDYTGTRTFNYDLGGTLDLRSEDLGSLVAGKRITYTLDSTTGAVGRPIGFTLGSSSSPASDQIATYGYGSDGRMDTFSANTSGYTNYAFSYSYASSSHLVNQISQSTVGFTDTRNYNGTHNWVGSRTVQVGSTTIAAFTYHRDNIGQVGTVDKTGAVYAQYGNGTQGLTTYYGYDDRNEVNSSQDVLGGTSTLLTGRDDGYYYDSIGNRTSVAHNGNSASYTSNSLNQIDHRDVVGIFDVAGAASTSATVTVNGSSSGITRHGQYFFKGQSLTNTSAPVYTTLAVSDGTTTSNLPAYLAKTAEYMTYDNDGNMTADGRWTYAYDAENRLITMQTSSAAVTAGAPNQYLSFMYDYLGRRIQKIVYLYSGGWVQQYQERYAYDGWNLIAVYDSSVTLQKSFFWGMDIRGFGQTAGGTGGLLMIQTGSQSYFPVYDAIGNVHGLVKASSGTLEGVYEYDAYGQSIRLSGSAALLNPFRYATKYTDDETKLVNFGRRYYFPSQGRFIGRDPLNENGGVHLYAFCVNNAVNRYDLLGMDPDFLTVDHPVYGPSDGIHTPQVIGYDTQTVFTLPAVTVNGNDSASGAGDSTALDDWALSYANNFGDPSFFLDGRTNDELREQLYQATYGDPNAPASVANDQVAQANHASLAAAANTPISIPSSSNPNSSSSSSSSGVVSVNGTASTGGIALPVNFPIITTGGPTTNPGPLTTTGTPSAPRTRDVGRIFTRVGNLAGTFLGFLGRGVSITLGFLATPTSMGDSEIPARYWGRLTFDINSLKYRNIWAARGPDALVPIVDSEGHRVGSIRFGDIPLGAVIGPEGVLQDAMHVQGGALGELTRTTKPLEPKTPEPPKNTPDKPGDSGKM